MKYIISTFSLTQTINEGTKLTITMKISWHQKDHNPKTLYIKKKAFKSTEFPIKRFWYGNNAIMLDPGLDTPSVGITAIKSIICVCAGNDRMLSYSGHIFQELCQERGATDFQILEPISLHHSCKTNKLNNNQHLNLSWTGAVCKKN